MTENFIIMKKFSNLDFCIIKGVRITRIRVLRTEFHTDHSDFNINGSHSHFLMMPDSIYFLIISVFISITFTQLVGRPEKIKISDFSGIRFDHLSKKEF